MTSWNVKYIKFIIHFIWKCFIWNTDQVCYESIIQYLVGTVIYKETSDNLLNLIFFIANYSNIFFCFFFLPAKPLCYRISRRWWDQVQRVLHWPYWRNQENCWIWIHDNCCSRQPIWEHGWQWQLEWNDQRTCWKSIHILNDSFSNIH